MENDNKRLAAIRRSLQNEDPDALISVIGSLRDNVSCPGVLPILAKLHESNSNDKVRSELESFFYDLKDQSLADELISTIDSSVKHDTRVMLISSCWQSGMEFSGYLDKFTEWSINGSYLEVIECYSVIDSISDTAGDEQKKEAVKRIKSSASGLGDDKSKLLKEIANLLL
jgi:hypothetical protein